MITRFTAGLVLAGLMLVIVGDTLVVGQDKVERRDSKTDKNVMVTGKIREESSTGFKMVVGGKEETIPAGDVVRVFYDDMPAGLKVAYTNLFLNEEKEKDPAKLLKDYQDFFLKANATQGVSAPAKRYLDYRITMLKVAAAADNDDTKGDAIGEARRALENFATTYKAGWEVPFTNRQLAKMHLDRQDYESAIKILNDLAASPAVSDDFRNEADLMLIDAMFQSDKTEAVTAKIDKALGDAKTTEAQKARFRIYKIGLEAQAPNSKLEETIKKLDDVIAKTPEPGTKALAYNIMGDVYAQRSMPRDAMWSYLWVDVVYSQDKAEHIKAVTKLLKYFKDEKDNEKVQIYREKLARIK